MKILPWLTLVCLLFLPIAAIAQEQGTADERQACEPDVNRLCSQFIPDRDKIILCLNQKVRELNSVVPRRHPVLCAAANLRGRQQSPLRRCRAGPGESARLLEQENPDG